MIHFDRFVLDNALRVLVHTDNTTPMAVVNIMYDVGARDEAPAKTGFAHLFEHLMFGGSINIPVFDEPLQRAGGENNAYTTNDLTNYYCQLPAENLETAFWLESDRMLNLAFSKKSLEVQRKVVCEEFKEHYINKPYGDIWHKLRALTYTTHPYQWMTIGKELSHVENATLDDVKNFFTKHYNPSNAILVVAGNVQLEAVKRLATQWFAPIPAGIRYERNLPQEPKQLVAKKMEVHANVPAHAFIKAWHIAPRLQKGYYIADLITEILGGGASSRMYEALVKNKQYFSSINCFHFGSLDAGLLVVEGKLSKGISFATAESAVQEEIEKIRKYTVSNLELEKIKNQTESAIVFEDISLTSRANSLAMYELLGDANLINTELEKYNAIGAEAIRTYSEEIFVETNSNTLYYYGTE